MRNKIKQLLKKEGGFTLVELLAVIVILGIIIGISIPLVGKVIANAEETTTKQQQALVIDAAQMYDLSNPDEELDTYSSTTLFNEGYLESEIDPPVTLTRTIDDDGKVTYEVSEE